MPAPDQTDTQQADTDSRPHGTVRDGTAPADSARDAIAPADSPDSTARLAHDLRIACMRVSRRVRFETTSTIAPHQLSVIVRLAQSSYSSGELAAIERVSAPSMSRTVGALVELGLVERATDSEDGRVVRLSLTDEGRRVLDEHRVRRDVWMIERLDGLSADERDLLARASELLNRVFDQ